MTIQQLLNQLAIGGFTATATPDCESLDITGPRRLPAELRQAIHVHKPRLLALLKPDYASQERWAIQHEQQLPPGTFNPAEFDGYVIGQEDYEYMYGPQDPGPEASPKQYGDYLDRKLQWQRERNPPPCGLCGGRTTHNSKCLALSDDWAPLMPIGKYKGTPIRKCPPDYLKWALANCSLTAEVKAEIEATLQAHKPIRNRQQKNTVCIRAKPRFVS